MWYYKMDSLGYNYRISDINCALGISQLKQVKAIIEKRRYIAKQYYKIFKDNTVILIMALLLLCSEWAFRKQKGMF